MQLEFTPAAERALAAAADWTSCEGCAELRVPEVLLALVAESDCRAALLLAPYGIDVTAVRRRFPQLARVEAGVARSGRLSAEWLACLDEAERLLIDYPRPLTLATEHLLLGIAAASNEASAWLREGGLDARALEAEVHRLAGYQPGPLPFESDDHDTGRETEIEIPEPIELVEHERVDALRIVDAAANRAGEGLRVIEDYLRFALDDRHLMTYAKAIRHELTAALEGIESIDRHHARETQTDVGTHVTLDSEQARSGPAGVAAASFKRVEQSLRSLEEFAKTIVPAAARMFEQLRYQVYTLERATDITRASLERLENARLYVLVDGGSSPRAFRQLIESLVMAGVRAIQLREKRLVDRELLERARVMRELTNASSTLFIMNDRPDLAALSGADGVHVGQDELCVKDARRVVGPSRLVGVSTHSLEQAKAAVLDGADYIGVGPTFASQTKQFADFPGPELLARVRAEIRLPAFAIGGVTLENLPLVKASGFTRVAVSAAITAAEDPGAAAARFLAALAD